MLYTKVRGKGIESWGWWHPTNEEGKSWMRRCSALVAWSGPTLLGKRPRR